MSLRPLAPPTRNGLCPHCLVWAQEIAIARTPSGSVFVSYACAACQKLVDAQIAELRARAA